jgi:pilus assembly protein CpaF
VLQPGADGRVQVATAWHVDTGFDCGEQHLTTLLRSRGRR